MVWSNSPFQNSPTIPFACFRTKDDNLPAPGKYTHLSTSSCHRSPLRANGYGIEAVLPAYFPDVIYGAQPPPKEKKDDPEVEAIPLIRRLCYPQSLLSIISPSSFYFP